MTTAAGVRVRRRRSRRTHAMIKLHRLTHPDQSFQLNPDLIQTIEATPDTFASTNMDQAKAIPALYKKAFGGSTLTPHDAMGQMVKFAEKARREGLLAL